jgi:phage portal protein BeeE
MKNPFKQLLQAAVRYAARTRLSAEIQYQLAQAFSRSASSDHPRTSEQMSANDSWAFAANRQIGGRGSRLHTKLFLNTTQIGEAPLSTQIYDHPWLDLVGKPNSEESGKIFLWRQIIQLNTIGRNHIRVIPETLDLSPLVGSTLTISRIHQLQLLNPDRCRPLAGENRRVAGYEYTDEITGQPERIAAAPWDRATREEWKRSPYEFVFTNVMPAADSIHGQSPMQSAKHAININASLNILHQNQLVNGLHAGLIFFLLQEIDDPKRFEAAVLLVKKGLGKAGEPIVLQKKRVEVQKNPLTNKEMEFPGLAEIARREILSVLGASDGLVGLVEDVNRSNIEGLERILAIGTIDPLMDIIADGYNSWLLPLYSGQSDRAWYECTFPSSAKGDDLTVAETLSTLTGGKPVIAPNEAREQLGLEPKPGGDSIEPKASGGGAVVPAEDREREEITEGEGEDVPLLTPGTLQQLPADHPLATEEGRTARWHELDEKRRKFEQRFRKDIAKVFRQWRDAFVKLIQAEGPNILETRQDEDDPMELEQWKERFAAAYGPAALAAVLAGAEQGFGSLELALALEPDDLTVEEYLKRHGIEFAGYITATQVDIIRDAMAEAAADGMNAEEAASYAKELFPTANSSRARTMATTAVGAALGFGVFEAGRRAREEVQKKKKLVGMVWLSQRDNFVRDTHAVADGQTIEVGEAFVVGGCLMRFPMDSELCSDAGEIINCRCLADTVILD